MKKGSILLVSLLISLLFIQCQTDEIISIPIENVFTEGEVITIEDPISSDITWTSGNTYILNELIAVTNNATLTIEPCVIVKAENGTTGLIIEQGAKLDAQGTSGCPIIFTSIKDQIEPGDIVSPNLTETDRGLWSGVFLLGNAPVSSIASSNVLSLLPPMQGQFTFGGNTPGDNSGTLRYVSIRHTGYETAPAEEPSGLTLGGVGSGTTIDHIELFANKDDGFLVVGGTVDVNNLLTSGFSDDGVDIDQGYAGTMNNIIGIGASTNNSSLELDGGEGPDNPSFTIKNASFKGSEAGENYINFQNQVNCRIEHSYFFGFDADAQVILDDEEDAENWLSELIDVVGLEFNTAHLTTGNTTIETIFVDAGANGNNAFLARTPDANIVSEPTVGADKSAFAGWTVAGQTGALDDF
jgi:hypothetical protein